MSEKYSVVGTDVLPESYAVDMTSEILTHLGLPADVKDGLALFAQ